MEIHAKRLLVIITEATLERLLISDARRFGAHGHTVCDVRGGGERGRRDAEWEADRMIRMEVICDPQVLDRLSEHVLSEYAPNYAVTLFTTEVGVFRPQKF